MMITFATGCSGIGAPETAWERLGWMSLWCSEIEPFPSAVLKHHWPEVPNHGDFNKLKERILSKDIPAPDVFIAGTPCQAFSLAGLRESLNDERGGLTLEYIRIADAMDSVRISEGKAPGVFIWENVPGVLSTKDNAFGCFLAGLAGEPEPIVPPKKWTTAGYVSGQKRQVAWRVLDAQFFGVAQRRRRVFVVASAGGVNPCEILFERKSLSRDSAESGEKRQGVAYSCSGFCNYTESELASTQRSCIAKQTDVDLVVCKSVVRRLTPTECDTPLVSIPLDLRNALRNPDKKDSTNRQGCGIGEPGDPANTLSSANCHGVIVFHPTQDPISHKDISHALGCGNSKGQCSSAVCISDNGTITEAYNVTFCDANGVRKDRPNGGCYVNKTDVAKTLSTSAPVETHIVSRQPDSSIVRRLTPLECERLQGFPDNHTNIQWKNKKESPDSLRYKSIGNSMAVPVIEWIGLRIQKVIRRLTN